MSCTEFETLSAYVDGEADVQQHEEAEAHLFVCAECRERYRSIRALRSLLAEDPPAQLLPRRLELSLATLMDRFVNESPMNLPVHPGTGFEGAPMLAKPFERTHRGLWLQALVAACVAVVTVLGMGVFALRSGGVPTLSMVDHRVTGLSNLGHAALYAHMERIAEPNRGVIPQRDAAQLERELRESLECRVHLPKTLLGEPRSAGIMELSSEPVAVAEYEFNGVPVSMFALPRVVAAEYMSLQVEDDPNACTMQELRQCFTDGLGTSLCMTSDAEMVWIWVAHLPKLSLEKLVPYPH